MISEGTGVSNSIKIEQRSDEKALRIFALVFSAFAWVFLLGLVVYAYTPFAPFSRVCVWRDQYAEEGDSEFGSSSYVQALQLGYEDSCLEKKDVPSEEYYYAEKKIVSDAIENRRSVVSVTVFYALIFGFFVYFINAISMAHIRLNAMRLGKKQYPDLYSSYESVARKIGLSELPPAYLIDAGGVANAFAIKIARKKMIVMYAELFERLLEEDKIDEVEAVFAHELAHVKFRHVNYWIFLYPFNLLPFLGKLLSRLQELSADRAMLAVSKNKDVAISALIKLVIGKKLKQVVNLDEYIENAKSERGIFVWLAKLLSTHPPIPDRVAKILNGG